MRLAVYWQGRVWRSSNELTPEQFAREQAKWESMGIVAVEATKIERSDDKCSRNSRRVGSSTAMCHLPA